MSDFTSKLRPMDAIKMAIEEEKRACKFYQEAAHSAEYASTKEMFLFLAEQEQKHRQMLEDELDKDFYSEV